MEIHNILIEDRTGNRILSVKNAEARLSLVKLFQQEIVIRRLRLEEAYVDYHIYKDSNNFSFLIDYFSSPKTDDDAPSSSMNLDLQQVELFNNTVKVVNHTVKHHHQGIDFGDLEISELSGSLSDIHYDKEHVSAKVEELTLKEKSGFFLQELSALSYVSNTKMEFDRLKLKTNQSNLQDYLLFEYQSFADFSDFIKKVHIQGTLINSYVDSKDIEYFAPSMQQVQFTTNIDQATVSGTVEHIKAQDVQLRTGKQTKLSGNFTIDGLPIIERTQFEMELEELTSSAQDLERLVPPLANMQSFDLPEMTHRFGQLTYQGKLSGLYHDFKINGTAKTDLGIIRTQTAINLRPILQYTGHIQSEGFNLGNLIQANILGTSGFTVEFDGEGTKKENLHLTADGALQQIFIKGHTYDHINFNSSFINQILAAEGKVQDPYASLNFKGEVNLFEDVPIYTFQSAVQHLNLKRTHLFERDSILIKNSDLQAVLSGNTLNSLNGEVLSDHIEFTSTRGEFSISYLDFSSTGDEKSKQMILKSDVADLELNGEIDLNSIAPYFRSLAMRYAPAINIEAKPYNPQNFDLKVNIKAFEPVSALFDPNLKLEDGARLDAQFSTDNYTANFKAFSPMVSYKGMKLKNLNITESADGRAFALQVDADRFSLSDSAYIDNIRITNELSNDSLHFNIVLSEEQRSNFLDLHGNIHFAYNQPAYIRFERSKIVLNEEDWSVNQDADLRVSKGKFYLNNLILRRDNQQVNIDGILSDENDRVAVAFKDFSLASFSGITRPLGIQLQGQMNGNVKIHSVFNSPSLSAHIQTSPIIYNHLPIGTLTIDADFEPNSGLMQLHSQLLNVQGNGFELAGTYDVKSTTNALQLQGKVKDSDLFLIQPFLKTLVSDLDGKISGDALITGTILNPTISGTATVKQANFKVNYLQTAYQLNNQPILIDKNRFHLANFKFQDNRNAVATAQGHLDLNKLSDPTLDIMVTADNFHVLNTQRKDNELFFGTAFASGSFKFQGPTSSIYMDIRAQSNANTVITIPFNTSLKISDNDFIYFVSKDSSSNEEAKQRNLFSGLTMNMDLSVTPDAEINLENNIGSLKATGTGAISLRISSLGDFEMFGDYNVVSGKFHFTAQDFFNKYFDIREGGTIRWTGNPSEATINVSALYQQRTSIAPLYNAAGRAENHERILAQADMNLRGTLSQPEVSFDLNFPQNPYIKDELQAFFSDANNVNQQAISLIVRRSFTPASTQEFGREVNNTLLSAGTEIAFNQLNSIISQSLNVNFFDLNIRSFNDASASLRFFNDRLVFTGGVTDNRNRQINDLTLFTDKVVTDAEMTFKLRQDGNLVLRAYNRLNARNFLFTPNSDYINAVGLVYRQEFNSLSEFWRKMWVWKERRKPEEQKTTTAAAQDSTSN